LTVSAWISFMLCFRLSSLLNRTCVEISGRVIAKVPDSPQQRSDNFTSSPIKAFTTASGCAVLIGVWHGSWYR
jgi:hypothetical protein